MMASFEIVARLDVSVNNGKGPNHGIVAEPDFAAVVVVLESDNCVRLDDAVTAHLGIVDHWLLTPREILIFRRPDKGEQTLPLLGCCSALVLVTSIEALDHRVKGAGEGSCGALSRKVSAHIL